MYVCAVLCIVVNKRHVEKQRREYDWNALKFFSWKNENEIKSFFSRRIRDLPSSFHLRVVLYKLRIVRIERMYHDSLG